MLTTTTLVMERCPSHRRLYRPYQKAGERRATDALNAEGGIASATNTTADIHVTPDGKFLFGSIAATTVSCALRSTQQMEVSCAWLAGHRHVERTSQLWHSSVEMAGRCQPKF